MIELCVQRCCKVVGQLPPQHRQEPTAQGEEGVEGPVEGEVGHRNGPQGFACDDGAPRNRTQLSGYLQTIRTTRPSEPQDHWNHKTTNSQRDPEDREEEEEAHGGVYVVRFASCAELSSNHDKLWRSHITQEKTRIFRQLGSCRIPAITGLTIPGIVPKVVGQLPPQHRQEPTAQVGQRGQQAVLRPDQVRSGGEQMRSDQGEEGVEGPVEGEVGHHNGPQGFACDDGAPRNRTQLSGYLQTIRTTRPSEPQDHWNHKTTNSQRDPEDRENAHCDQVASTHVCSDGRQQGKDCSTQNPKSQQPLGTIAASQEEEEAHGGVYVVRFASCAELSSNHDKLWRSHVVGQLPPQHRQEPTAQVGQRGQQAVLRPDQVRSGGKQMRSDQGEEGVECPVGAEVGHRNGPHGSACDDGAPRNRTQLSGHLQTIRTTLTVMVSSLVLSRGGAQNADCDQVASTHVCSDGGQQGKDRSTQNSKSHQPLGTVAASQCCPGFCIPHSFGRRELMSRQCWFHFDYFHPCPSDSLSPLVRECGLFPRLLWALRVGASRGVDTLAATARWDAEDALGHRTKAMSMEESEEPEEHWSKREASLVQGVSVLLLPTAEPLRLLGALPWQEELPQGLGQRRAG
ncbi:hypothetical protein CRUP_026869 [Coryphaenoides rupestris]|nr:hypothetical protein CRUP_026869 [Coryphaenoides rupestris]